MNLNDERNSFLEIIYQHNYRKLENFCLHYVNYSHEFRGIIDECIQDTMLQAVEDYRILSGYPDDRVDAWLMKTCKNQFITAVATYRRRRKRHAFTLDERFTLPEEQLCDMMDDYIDHLHDQEYAYRIIAMLNDREQRVVDMRFNHNMSFAEIAEQEHSTIGAVKAVLARLISKVRKEAEKNPHHFFTFFVSILLVMRYRG